jgi:uncharacterized protein with PIN domain
MKRPRPALLFDRMLGRLCRTLRLLGYDAELNREGESGRFFLNAEALSRVAVTRSRGLGDRPGARPIVLESEETLDQIVELFSKLGCKPDLAPFTRCLECNELLTEEPSEAVRDDVPSSIMGNFDEFHRCPACRRVFWRGSHFEAMARKIEEIERILSG